MDPWPERGTTTSSSESKAVEQVFDNSFLTKPVCHTTNTQARLPDSSLYVSKLEERLKLLQKGGQLKEQLEQAKEDALIRLVRSNSCAVLEEEDLELDQELDTSYLYRRLAPHKTALTKGEKVLLLAADQLAIKLAQSDISGDSSDDRSIKTTLEDDKLEEN